MERLVKGIIQTGNIVLKAAIGIDNGTSGSIGIITKKEYFFYRGTEYTFMEQDYTKKKQNITRIDVRKLRNILIPFIHPKTIVLLERPCTMKFPKQNTRAARAYEATINTIDLLDGIARDTIDSRTWNRLIFKRTVQGTIALKQLSMEVGCRMFPACKQKITKQKDADGLLIAEYARQFYW